MKVAFFLARRIDFYPGCRKEKPRITLATRRIARSRDEEGTLAARISNGDISSLNIGRPLKAGSFTIVFRHLVEACWHRSTVLRHPGQRHIDYEALLVVAALALCEVPFCNFTLDGLSEGRDGACLLYTSPSPRDS